MTVNAEYIQTGLLHFQRTVSNSSVSNLGLNPLYVAHARPVSNPLNPAYTKNADPVNPSYIEHAKKVNNAPPPSALESLRELVQSSYDDEKMNGLVKQWFSDAESGKSPVQLTGPLAVKADLELYETFLAWEATRNKHPRSSAAFKDLASGGFALERESAWHKSASLMELLIVYFKRHFVQRNARVTFSQFVTLLTAEDLTRLWYAPDAGYTQECIRRFIQGVRYLTPEKAARYNVTSRGQNLFWEKWGNTTPLDTTIAKFFERKHETPRLGEMDAGAIWILSKEDRLYTHPSKVHRFHHSSFASGDVIRCGGHWEVKNGKLMWISAWSGHYQPGLQHLYNAVKIFANKFGINANHFKVRLFSKEKGPPREVLLPASQLLFDLQHVEAKYKVIPN